jgi:hypothetical protein
MSGRTDVPDAAPEMAVSVVIRTSKAVAKASGEWVGLLADDRGARTLVRELCPPLLWRGLRGARELFNVRQPRTVP